MSCVFRYATPVPRREESNLHLDHSRIERVLGLGHPSRGLLLRHAALCQLSYSPVLEGPAGIEPALLVRKPALDCASARLLRLKQER